MEAVLKTRQSRTKTRTLESNQAYQAWEERKAFLGITRDLPREEKLAAMLLKRHGTVERVPTRYRARAERQERARQRPRSRHRGQDTRSLAAQVAALAARLGGEELAPGGGLRVRLWDREKEQGMGW